MPIDIALPVRVFALGLWLVTTVATATHPALEQMQNLADESITTLQRNEAELETNPSRVYGLMRDILNPYIDFPRMSRLVLGNHWRQASEVQRRDFTEAFSEFAVRFYAQAIADFIVEEGVPDDIAVEFMPFRAREDDRTVTVATLLKASDQTLVNVGYRLYQTGGRWMAFDVVVERVSVVRNYRNTFNQEIRRHGLDNLIQRLQERNDRA
ncbi:MAG: phospholipid-binding protein MlaC [Candidatus Competibacterales bacterium]